MSAQGPPNPGFHSFTYTPGDEDGEGLQSVVFRDRAGNSLRVDDVVDFDELRRVTRAHAPLPGADRALGSWQTCIVIHRPVACTRGLRWPSLLFCLTLSSNWFYFLLTIL